MKCLGQTKTSMRFHVAGQL